MRLMSRWLPLNGTVLCRLLRGLSQIVFPTVSVILTLRGGGGSEGVTLIFYLKHTLTFVIILLCTHVSEG